MLSDTDQFKHMSFANYLKLMFLATDALFISSYKGLFLDEYRVKAVNSKMQFKKQTIAGENILIKINSTDVQDTKFSLLHTFMIEGSAELVGLGRQTYELLLLENNRPVILPEGIKLVLGPISVIEENQLYKYV